MKPTKEIRRQVDELNRVIHTRNLYSGHSRFIDAKHDGYLGICVRNLQTDEVVPFVAGQFRDGQGEAVTL